MGPRLEAVEDTLTVAYRSPTQSLQWGHGLQPWKSEHADPKHQGLSDGFNGATARSRGNQHCYCRTCNRMYGFNGATALKPWKLLPTGLSLRHSSRFNGATALQPWK